MTTLTSKCYGHYEIYKNGDYVGESDNVITNGFIGRFASNQTSINNAFCLAGSGNTTPTITDTTLTTPIGNGVTTAHAYNRQNAYINGSNYIVDVVYAFTFPIGTFVGSVRELGVRFHTTSSGITSSSEVDSKVLVRDGDGLLTTITMTSDDTLTVIFKFQTVLDVLASSQINIAGTDYTITYELLNYTSWFPSIDWDTNYYGNMQTALVINSRGLVNNPADTTVPAGTSTSLAAETLTLIGTNVLNYKVEMNISEANMLAGVEYIQFRRASTPVLQYGVHFSPPLSSATAETFSLTLGHQIISGDPNFNSVTLLMHMNGTDGSQTFTDDSISSHAVSVSGNTQIDTASFKFGGASGLFDGSGDYLSIPYVSGDFDWFVEDYTIEFWVNGNVFNSDWESNGQPNCVGRMSATTGTNYWSFGPKSGGTLAFYYFTGVQNQVITTATINTNTWTHCAMCHSGSNILLFIDGVLDSTVAVSGSPQSVSENLTIGSMNGVEINGSIDDLRITRGVARYTATFTPPTTQFPDST